MGSANSLTWSSESVASFSFVNSEVISRSNLGTMVDHLDLRHLVALKDIHAVRDPLDAGSKYYPHARAVDVTVSFLEQFFGDLPHHYAPVPAVFGSGMPSTTSALIRSRPIQCAVSSMSFFKSVRSLSSHRFT